MPRDASVYLQDILDAAERIGQYIGGIDYEEFAADAKTCDAVVRNLEIIGEAAKKLPESLKLNAPQVEWRKIAGISPMYRPKISSLLMAGIPTAH